MVRSASRLGVVDYLNELAPKYALLARSTRLCKLFPRAEARSTAPSSACGVGGTAPRTGQEAVLAERAPWSMAGCGDSAGGPRSGGVEIARGDASDVWPNLSKSATMPARSMKTERGSLRPMGARVPPLGALQRAEDAGR